MEAPNLSEPSLAAILTRGRTDSPAPAAKLPPTRRPSPAQYPLLLPSLAVPPCYNRPAYAAHPIRSPSNGHPLTDGASGILAKTVRTPATVRASLVGAPLFTGRTRLRRYSSGCARLPLLLLPSASPIAPAGLKEQATLCRNAAHGRVLQAGRPSTLQRPSRPLPAGR